MIRLIGPNDALAKTRIESRFTPEKLAWLHLVNITNTAWEVLDDAGEVRGILRWWGESIIPLRVRAEYLILNPIGVTTLTSPTSAAQAVYMGITEEEPRVGSSFYT